MKIFMAIRLTTNNMNYTKNTKYINMTEGKVTD